MKGSFSPGATSTLHVRFSAAASPRFSIGSRRRVVRTLGRASVRECHPRCAGAHSRGHGTQDPGRPLIGIRISPDGASGESMRWSGWRFAHVDGCAPGAASGSLAASVGCVASGRPGGRRRHRLVVGIDRAFFSGQRAAVVAAGAVRGAGDRCPLRHLRRPGEPREAERAHDRAPRGRPPCVLEAGPKGRGLRISRAGRGTPPPSRRSTRAGSRAR